MSKGDSHLFTGTRGEAKALIDEVIANGYKISPEKVLMITKDANGRIAWLETGNKKSGLQHILEEHEDQFNDHGIIKEDIPNYILEAFYQGNIVGTQGNKNPRTIYDFDYNGKKQRIAIQIGSNGYIVSANPKSLRRKLK